MKTRNGFVSNSSSASFIIKLNCDKQTAINHITSVYDDRFERERLEKKIQSDIDYWKSSKDKQFLIYNREETIKELEEQREKIKENFIDVLLNRNNIEIDEEDSKAIVKKWVVMFNDYNDMEALLTNWLFTLKVDGFDFDLSVEEDY